MSKQTINYNSMQSIYLCHLYFNIQNGKLWNGLIGLINNMIFEADVRGVKKALIGEKNICNDIEKIKQYDYYINICNKRLEDFR